MLLALQDIGKKVAMHIASAAPLALTESDIPADRVERERAVLVEQIKEDPKAQGKPPQGLPQTLHFSCLLPPFTARAASRTLGLRRTANDGLTNAGGMTVAHKFVTSCYGIECFGWGRSAVRGKKITDL